MGAQEIVNSVHDEQFGDTENTSLNTTGKMKEKKSKPAKKPGKTSKGTVSKKKTGTVQPEIAEEVPSKKKPPARSKKPAGKTTSRKSVKKAEAIVTEIDENIVIESNQVEKAVLSIPEIDENILVEDNREEKIILPVHEIDENIVIEGDQEDKAVLPAPEIDENFIVAGNQEDLLHEENITADMPEITDQGDRIKEHKIETRLSDLVNYSSLSKEELIKTFSELLTTRHINDIRHDVENIKINFYKKHKVEVEQLRKKFIDGGGLAEDFILPVDPLEEKIRELLKKYRDIKTEQNKVQDNEKLENLRLKYEIIEEIKELINSEESINRTFHDFRELLNRWREIGVVPQQNLNDLWETYHHHVEKFYDYIKINKELRDLDLKKNLELKIKLCEKAEILLIESNVVNSFGILQKYHEEWREIGPVPKEKRTEIWERFREATAKINKKHQQHYQDLKEIQKKNLESKIALCERVELINSEKNDQHKQWVARTNDILELQKIWKTIGFAPKKENNKVYARFRTACDLFFERKRGFYAQSLEDQNNNLQMKLDLCVQAETLKNSTDWKKTSEEYIRLQKKWKQIGPVPRKQSDAVWKRFRTACDNFFERKAEFFSKIDNTYEGNLKAKEDLIREIQEFQKTDNVDQNLEKLQEFQRRWTEIGFVPFNKKEEIQEKYRELINNHYDSLEMDDFKKNILKFRNRLEAILQKPKPEVKLRFEREKYMNKLQQLKNDIGVWENNIGFFSNSKNADSMLKDFEEKINDAKLTIRTLEEKITILDELEFDY